MASWKELTQSDGTYILVNLDNICTIISNPDDKQHLTMIRFVGLEEVIHVKERPNEILGLYRSDALPRRES
jgi:hypothetical protein